MKVSIKEYFETKFAELEKRLEVTFALHKTALEKAENEMLIRIVLIEDEIKELKKRPTFISATIASVITFIVGVLGALLIKGLM